MASGAPPRGLLGRRRGRVALASLVFVGCAAFWCFQAPEDAGGAAFTGAARSTITWRGGGSSVGGTARRAFDFRLAENEAHQSLRMRSEKDGDIQKTLIQTRGAGSLGVYNTVLGDTEIPASGRSYWEVRVAGKPNEAWELIGVTESKANVSRPLHKNRSGAKTWALGATRRQSMMYITIDVPKEWNTDHVKNMEEYAKTKPYKLQSRSNVVETVYPKDWEKQHTESLKITGEFNRWKDVPHTTYGIHPERFPRLPKGTVVGVDVNMDDGTLAFWNEGKRTVVKDATGKPVNVKGQKLVPAVSIYGDKHSPTTLEVRTGLEPPPIE